MMIPLNSTHLRPHLDAVSFGLGSPVQERQCQASVSPPEAHQHAEGTGAPAPPGEPEGWRWICLEKRRLWEKFRAAFSYL